ncbi:MAG: glycoside hydrolase family 16 protein [Pseudomonadota bacterium]
MRIATKEILQKNALAILSLLLFTYLALAQPAFADDMTTSQEGELDLSGYTRVFTDDFDTLDVSAYRCNTRWIAHTPYNGDFGDATFANPRPGFPFKTKDGVLRIEASKDYDGGWQTGNLSSQNTCGTGYTQQFGYFEARIKLPSGKGVWPAFWLLTTDDDGYRGELDAIEFYGHMPNKFQSAFKLHSLGTDIKEFGELKWLDVSEDQLTSSFNTYGISIEPDFIKYYFNRKQYWQIQTPEEFKLPWYMLVTLALGSGYSIQETPSPSYMYVDYIHAYQKTKAD